jgi:hypothetical protein
VPAGTTGAATYTYEVAAYDNNGDTLPSATTSISNGNASLAGPNGNVITWTAPVTLAGAVVGYKVIRTVGGPSQGLIATVLATSPLTFTDNGGAATVYTPSVAAPGQVVVVTGPSEV